MTFPILSSLILLPTIGALFIFFVRSSNKQYQSSKYVALFITVANFILSIYLWFVFDKSTVEFQFVEDREWIVGFVNYKVGVDGISILFILLSILSIYHYYSIATAHSAGPCCELYAVSDLL